MSAVAEPVGASSMRLVRAWHALLAAVICAALVAQIALIVAGGTDANSGHVDGHVSLAARLVRLFSYFTIQSNLLVAAAAATFAIDPARDGTWWRVLRLDALLGIATTGLVFAIVLAPILHLQGLAAVVSDAFHVASPCMALLGWLLFGPRPRIGWQTVALSLLWPATWLAYTFIHGALTGWYPYPFLNAAAIGYSAALRNTAVVLAGAGVFVLVLRALDRWLPAPLLSMRRWREPAVKPMQQHDSEASLR
ncbi:Pr6Pr family membrane protein [Ralstonia soli]|uniref:Pr6Pr family membrane protein n=1 Tax=Ralstonia soli TaxID=2953896 RepID=A0ABT1AJY7_9RALS|nr:Pr6Pr family membrane protein [Ralstonia soli]MCO5398706.1 Pr6Pr family membrane protein [Ralstonia soli]